MKTQLGKCGKYLIGDVAQIVGMSRDALRFYEKKGVIQAEKKENGYRCYSEKDIYKLMYIIYHRKMNASLKDIEELMVKDGKGTMEFLAEYLEEAVKREEEEVENHKRIIARLELTKRDIGNMNRHIGTFCMKDLPQMYVIGEYQTFKEGLENWFRFSSIGEGMDMSYFYTEMSFDGNDIKIKDTRLVIYKGLENKARLGFDLSGCREIQSEPCVYTVVESKDHAPGLKSLMDMAAWGRERGMETDGRVYVNNFTSCSWHDSPSYFMEVYMPVK